MLDRSASTALHLQLEEQLRGAITHGRLGAGTALPPEPRFADELGVARGTVRQALQQLVREGLLERQRGHGTFVVDAMSSLLADAVRTHVPAPDVATIQQRLGTWESGTLDVAAVDALRAELAEVMSRQQRQDEALRRENAQLREEMSALRTQLGAHIEQLNLLRTMLDTQLTPRSRKNGRAGHQE